MKRDNLFLGLASLILILVIFGPYAVSSGYFLTVDWIYADKLWPVETLYYPNQYPWILLQGWLSEIIPAFIVQKIVLAGLLLLSFSSTAFLLRRSNASNRWLILVGMIFFVFNSFFYARFAQGQVYLLLGHALLPYVLGYWLYARDR
ncbi:MAG TPA: hypothetical protein PK765_03820 [bacterium]|nr:hypothetical protein [bacterium]